MSSKLFCGEQKQSGKNIEYFLRYFQKPCFFGFSKWYVRPSFRQYKLALTPGTPLRENRRLEHSTCKTRHSTCKTRHSTCKTRHSTCKTRHSTCEASHSTCKSSTVRARLGTARARMGYTLKGKKIPYKFVPPHL